MGITISSTITNVRLLSREGMKFTIRTFGVGGLFGYWGMFSNSRIGRFRMFATRRDRTVLIETTEGKKIVITPDEPEVFVGTIKSLKGKNGHSFNISHLQNKV